MHTRSRILLPAAVAAVLWGAAAGADNHSYLDIARSADGDYQFRASDVLNMDVINLNEEEIGEVDDVIFGSREGGPAAVISVGGFLGLGEKLVTVPVESLKLSADREHVVLDATEEQLEALPEFAYISGEKTWAELREERQEIRAETKAEIADARAEARQELEEAQAELDAEIWSQISANWQQFKGQVQQQWGELTDDQLDIVQGRRDELIGMVQEQYGIAYEEAQQQVNDWARAL